MPSYSVTDFVSACRSFSNDSLTADNTQVLRQVTEQQMPEQYCMPFPEPNLAPIPTQKEKEQHLRGIWHELAQHLRDLQYLTEEAFIFHHEHKKDILRHPTLCHPLVEAVKVYLSEESEWDEKKELLPEGREPNLLWLSRHLSVVVNRIGQHTCWDGGHLIPKKYRVGEATVFGRALAYRLRTLSSGQFMFSSLGTYYQGEQHSTLNALFNSGFSVRGEAREKTIPRGYWTALGDIDRLVVSYVHNIPEKEDLTLLYQLPFEEEGKLQTPLAELRRRDLKHMDADWDEFQRKTARQIVNSARRRDKRDENGLDIRLLQIKLWQAGYYTGAIDGEWSALSHRGLKTFLMDEAQLIVETKLTGKQLKKKKRKAAKEAGRIRSLLVIANKKQQVYAADFKAVLQQLGVDMRARANKLNLRDEAALIREMPEAAGITNAAFDEKILQEEELGQFYPDNVQKPKRRVSFFRKLGGFIVGGLNKIAKWLKDKIQDVAKLLGPVFSFVKKLLRPIRTAIHRFFQGFKYLASFVLGKPLLTVTKPATATELPRIFATKFQLDFDSINLVPSDAEPEEAILHTNHIHKMRQDMGYFIGSVVWIIKAIGKLSNPGGWVWLGWQMVKGIARGVMEAGKKEVLG